MCGCVPVGVMNAAPRLFLSCVVMPACSERCVSNETGHEYETEDFPYKPHRTLQNTLFCHEALKQNGHHSPYFNI
jgi:hypothetical protein